MSLNKTLLMVANVDWIFIAHRLPIAKEALKRGFRVVVLANDTGRSKEILDEGIEFVNLSMSRSGTNPINEFLTLIKMFFLYFKIRPSLIYQVTLKPVIYGTLISRFLGIPTVNAISGLGYNFTGERKGLLQLFMVKLMRLGFNKVKNHLIFENEDDKKELFQLGVIPICVTTSLVKGVGVDLFSNAYTPPVHKKKLVVLLATRMLWDKGVKEFVEAAMVLREKYEHKVYFKLCGRLDAGNPEAVSEQCLNDFEVDGYLKWEGYSNRIFDEYKESDIVVLPSFREGMPTVLIEASAVGRPLITTEAIGCKECVVEGWNGFKVPVKSVSELVMAIEKLLINEELRLHMGVNSRAKAEKEYDLREVVKKHIDFCENILN